MNNCTQSYIKHFVLSDNSFGERERVLCTKKYKSLSTSTTRNILLKISWMGAYYTPGCVHIIYLDVCILYTWMCAYYTPGCVHIIYLDVYILYTWKCAYYTPGCVHINTPGCVHIIHLDVYILYTWMCA